VIKDAFAKAGGVQCGFCTPGMIIATESLLNKNPNPTDFEIKIGLSGNLCRCTGYNLIIEAVKIAAKEGEGLW
jgi:carbon-monoxide dehydrogenase small subunit